MRVINIQPHDTAPAKAGLLSVIKSAIRKKPLTYLVYSLCFLLAISLLTRDPGPKKAVVVRDNNAVSTTSDSQDNQKSSTISITLAGDFLAHAAINEEALLVDNKYSYASMFGDTPAVMSKYDIRFCNNGVLNGGEAFGITGYPQFNAPEQWAGDMVGAGCNLINLAHNHINDRTQAAITTSVNTWADQDVLAFAGANRSLSEHDAGAKYFTVKGVRVAFLAYTTYTNIVGQTAYGLNMWDDTLSAAEISRASNQADIVMVSMRWGTEYSSEINSEQTRIARILVDSGADLVVGHGPHVLQPVVKDGDSYIFYSIGNYFHAQVENETLYECLFTLDLDTSTKSFGQPACIQMYMHYDWSDSDKADESLLKRTGFRLYQLSKSGDLPRTGHTRTTAAEQTARIKSILGDGIILK
jgi:poly-gamma-glutamate capsule biosynthesis protein CapA/YwtB (metallophosphatase superfamily)